MIVLDNECTAGTRIIIDNDNFVIKDYKEITAKIQGIGGFTDDNQLLGLYIQNNEIYFLFNNNSFLLQNHEIRIDNQYISKEERLFKVMTKGRILCEIKYKPYIDPGMLIYDSDEDEFDFLLRFYKMLKDTESFENTIKYIKRLNK